MGLKSRRKCPNFGLQGSVIDVLLAGLKSLRTYPNYGLHGSVIDGLLAGLKSRRKCANFREFWPTGIRYCWAIRVKRCISSGNFQFVISTSCITFSQWLDFLLFTSKTLLISVIGIGKVAKGLKNRIFLAKFVGCFCLWRLHFQLVINRNKKLQEISEFWHMGY